MCDRNQLGLKNFPKPSQVSNHESLIGGRVSFRGGLDLLSVDAPPDFHFHVVQVVTADCTGCRLFGGHSMRVAGSKFWVCHGLEVYKLQIFARWGSATVLRYVADAPTANLTGDCLRLRPRPAVRFRVYFACSRNTSLRRPAK